MLFTIATNIIFALIFLKVATSTRNAFLYAFWLLIFESFMKLGLGQMVKECLCCCQESSIRAKLPYY